MVFYNQSPECIMKIIMKVLLLNATVLFDCDESCKHLVNEIPGKGLP